jgi:hypothetical protein
MADDKLLPRNRTARLADVRAAGNPMVAELESGVGNCFPGLKVDLRNLERRFFPYIAVDFIGAQIAVAEVDLDAAEQQLTPGPLLDGLRRLATEAPGTWRVTRLTGDFAGFGRLSLAVPRDLAPRRHRTPGRQCGSCGPVPRWSWRCSAWEGPPHPGWS